MELNKLKKLYVVRHANAPALVGGAGKIDDPRVLSGNGWNQANKLAEVLAPRLEDDLNDGLFLQLVKSPAIRVDQTLEPTITHVGLINQVVEPSLMYAETQEDRDLLDSGFKRLGYKSIEVFLADLEVGEACRRYCQFSAQKVLAHADETDCDGLVIAGHGGYAITGTLYQALLELGFHPDEEFVKVVANHAMGEGECIFVDLISKTTTILNPAQ